MCVCEGGNAKKKIKQAWQDVGFGLSEMEGPGGYEQGENRATLPAV